MRKYKLDIDVMKGTFKEIQTKIKYFQLAL